MNRGLMDGKNRPDRVPAPYDRFTAQHQPVVSAARWAFTPPVGHGAANAWTAGQYLLNPMPIGEMIAIDAFSYNVTTLGTSGTSWLMLYNSQDGLPHQLVQAVSISVAAVANVIPTFPPITLPPGLYWLGMLVVTAHSGTSRGYSNPWVPLPNMNSQSVVGGVGVNVSTTVPHSSIDPLVLVSTGSAQPKIGYRIHSVARSR